MRMERSVSARALWSAPLVAAALLLGGCASMGPQEPEQVVRERAQEYWDARIKADVKRAYALLTPAYRELRTQENFQRNEGAGVSLRKVEVVKVTCEPERCEVRLALTGKPPVPGLNLPTVTTHMNEIWLKVDGRWWRHIDQ